MIYILILHCRENSIIFSNIFRLLSKKMIIYNFQNTEINFVPEIYLSKELLSTTSRNRHKIGCHTTQPKCLKTRSRFSFSAV